MVTPDSEKSLPSLNLLRILLRRLLVLYTRFSLSLIAYSTAFYYHQTSDVGVLQPRNKLRFGLFPVRSSLTKGITYVLYSFSYLDISVRRVPSLHKCRVIMISHDVISQFGHLWITAFCQLPRDFRGLSVLRRLDKPRHPLFALSHINNKINFSFLRE